jgi:transcriptional regulator with XRE-family HTH domain
MPKIDGQIQQASRAIGQQVRTAREAKGISIRRAAREFGCSPRFILEIEQGKPTARMDKVLQTLLALGLQFAVEGRQPAPAMDARSKERVEARAAQRIREEKLGRAHERIAARLALGEIAPRDIERARGQVRKWAEQQICSRWYVDRWSEILAGEGPAIASRMLGLNAADAKALFQNTPFGFLVREELRA